MRVARLGAFRLGAMSLAQLAPGTLVQQTNDPRVFLVNSNGALQLIPDANTFQAMGFNWQSIVQIPSLQGYAIGAALPAIAAAVPIAAAAASTVTASTGNWFTDPTQEIFSGIPNFALLGGAAVLLFVMMRKK